MLNRSKTISPIAMPNRPVRITQATVTPVDPPRSRDATIANGVETVRGRRLSASLGGSAKRRPNAQAVPRPMDTAAVTPAARVSG
jgi:hypothetical protein